MAEERERQVRVEGWLARDDDQHSQGELKLAAVCYALGGTKPRHNFLISDVWPWGLPFWKPKSELQNLVRAGALIAAEIDRLLRAEERAKLNAAAEDEKP